MRILKHGGASEDAINFARNFKCDVCDSQAKPKIAKPASVDRVPQPLSEIQCDVKQLPDWRGDETWRCLNIVDNGSSLQPMIPLDGNKEDVGEMRKAYAEGWRRPYGAPDRLRADAARANTASHLVQKLSEDGVDIATIAGETHWQLGNASVTGNGSMPSSRRASLWCSRPLMPNGVSVLLPSLIKIIDFSENMDTPLTNMSSVEIQHCRQSSSETTPT